MTARMLALAIAALAIGLVVAQDFYPHTAFYHTWQYALLLVLCAIVIVNYAHAALGGDDGPLGRRAVVAIAGAFVVIVAGLISGLLGPDTVVVSRPPGTVAPLPDLRAAAFFAQADPPTIAAGNATVTLRRRDKAPVVIAPGGRSYLDASVLYLDASPAAFIEARDGAGRHLTVTQPTSGAFLSPVLLFRDRQMIGQRLLPFDAFSVPALGRTVKAIYFSAHETEVMKAHGDLAGKPAILFAVDDDKGKPLGIMLALSDRDVVIGGMHLRATLGAYPTLSVASAPLVPVLLTGVALFIVGCAWTLAGGKRERQPAPLGARRAPAGS